MASSEDHIEVEWQYATDDVDAAAEWFSVANVPGYTITPGRTRDQHDSYYDTYDWRLHRAGFTCRTRTKGNEAELTLKGMASATDGMRSRREINEQLPAPSLDPLPGGAAGRLLRLIAGRHPLRQLFSLDNHRRIFNLADAAGPLAEIAVDDVTVGSQNELPPCRFFRIEVEVDSEAIERAQRFVELMVVTLGLSPAPMSKFQTALEATDQETPAPDHLGSTAIAAMMTAGQVGFAVMRKHFAVFLANEGGTRVGDDIEALHDMRVAARRLRAAMSAFAPYLSPRLQSLRAQLGWVAAALGEVRDLDVQLERMAEWREAAGPGREHALDAVEALLLSKREVTRKRMLAVLDTRRYDIFVERFTSALRRGPARAFVAGHRPILDAAPDLLEKRYRRFRREGDLVKPASPPEAYHALRIDAKKLRYALEFVGPIYGKPATEFSARVTAIQDVLGLHQDAEVAVTMLSEMATAPRSKLPPATILAMGAIAERYRMDAVRLRAKFPSVYKPLRGREWTALRKLVESRRPRPNR